MATPLRIFAIENEYEYATLPLPKEPSVKLCGYNEQPNSVVNFNADQQGNRVSFSVRAFPETIENYVPACCCMVHIVRATHATMWFQLVFSILAAVFAITATVVLVCKNEGNCASLMALSACGPLLCTGCMCSMHWMAKLHQVVNTSQNNHKKTCVIVGYVITALLVVKIAGFAAMAWHKYKDCPLGIYGAATILVILTPGQFICCCLLRKVCDYYERKEKYFAALSKIEAKIL